ncbi:MAG: hypothetical protein ACK4NC_01660 [Candidatus Gracilibacteria bacterium]
MIRQKLKRTGIASGALVLSLVLLSGCAESSLTSDISKSSNTVASTDCTLLRNGMQKNFETRVKDLQDSSTALQTAVSKNQGDKKLTPETLQVFNESKIYPRLALEQLELLKNVPNYEDFLNESKVLDGILDTAAKVQSDVMTQAGKDLGTVITLAADVQTPLATNIASLEKNLLDLDAEASLLQENAALSLDAKAALDKLHARISITENLINTQKGTHINANALLAAGGDVHFALKALEKSLVEAKAKVTSSIGADAAAKLLLNTNLTDGVLKKAAPEKVENTLDVKGSVKIPAVKPATKPAVPAKPTSPSTGVNVDVKGTVNGATNTLNTTGGVNVNVPSATAPVSGTVNGAVDATLQEAGSVTNGVSGTVDVLLK